MFLGMLFGSDGLFKISFADYNLTAKLCSIGLIFIIFYGGFCTKKPENKKITLQAILLSSVGTVLTAGLCFVFCYFVLKMPIIESFLIGSVISSTDAASVFSILRSKRLNLKYSTAPLLEMESGSNDPFAYMLTILGLILLKGESATSLFSMLFCQLAFGVLIGVLVAKFANFIFSKTKIITEGYDTIFLVALALLAFSLPELIGGNGYLSVYLAGLIIGNSEIKNKIAMVHFFDGVTGLCQVLIFFLIGFLSFPHKIPDILLPALLITAFLSFVARPLALFAAMLPFGAKLKQITFMSWAGLRGAASIVFALLVVAQSSSLKYDMFHIVFVVAFISVALQGSLLPYIARKNDMIDKFQDVRKTFNDFQQESAISLSTFKIENSHPWLNLPIKKANIQEGSLILYIKRNDEKIIPNGDTVLLLNDEVILGSTVSKIENEPEVNLVETFVDKTHEWLDKKISEINYPDNFLIALVKRKEKFFVPNGETTILFGDTIIFQED